MAGPCLTTLHRRCAGWGSIARPLRWYMGATPCASDQTVFCIEHRRALFSLSSNASSLHLALWYALNDPVLSQLERTLDCMLQE